MTRSSLSTPFRFWRSPVFGGMVGAIAALLMSGLSAFALRRLGTDMNWLAVLSGGVAGGLVGHGMLRGVLWWLAHARPASTHLDRFVWLIVSGFLVSLVFGAALLFVVIRWNAGGDGSSARTLGPAIFPVIGWIVGILAASLPLAITELVQSE